MIDYENKMLTEASIMDYMTTLANKSLEYNQKQGHLDKEDEEPEQKKEFDVAAAAAKGAPCIIIVGSNGEHATITENIISESDVTNFAAHVVKNVETITMKDKKNYKAYLYTVKKKKPLLVREFTLVDGAQEIKEVSDFYRYTITIKDVDKNETKLKDKSVILPNEKAGESFTKLNEKLKKTIGIDDYNLSNESDNTKPIDKDIEVGDNFHSFQLKKVGNINVPFYTNFEVTGINVSDKTVTLQPFDGNQNITKDIDVDITTLKGKYYSGWFYTKGVSITNACEVILKVTKETGKEPASIPSFESFVSTKENIERWTKSTKALEAFDGKHIITPNTKLRDVEITAYNFEKNPIKKVLVNFNNISNIKNEICKLLSDNSVYYIDAYDENGVCHYQAQRMEEDLMTEQLRTYWNVMEDDFFNSDSDSIVSLNINEEAGQHEYLVTIHLPYFDVNDADNMDDNNTTKNLKINAGSEEEAKKFAEQYIRTQSFKDETWTDAFIENIDSNE